MAYMLHVGRDSCLFSLLRVFKETLKLSSGLRFVIQRFRNAFLEVFILRVWDLRYYLFTYS